MPDAAWKQFERTIAKYFGGKRRGAYTGSNGQGKSDIIRDGYSVECKLLSRIGWQDCLDAVEQAKENAEGLDIPIAVMKRKGDHFNHCLVLMDLKDFVDYFVSASGAETGGEDSGG